VTFRSSPFAAAAIAAAAIGAWAAGGEAADPLAQGEREAAAAEARVDAAERAEVPGAELPALVAERRLEAARRQIGLGDWRNAALLLAAAVDEPEWSASPRRPGALFLLADALRRDGLCGPARVRYAAYLAAGAAEHRGEAVAGALECAVRERRQGDVDRLLVEAEQVFGDDPPPDVRYLAAKALFQRKDLPEEERVARAREAFARVGPPFQLQAWYVLGVLGIQGGNVDDDAIPWFTPCAWADARTPRDVELRDLCRLALGRVHAQMGDVAAALDAYRAVSLDSPHLLEALKETAGAHVRAKQLDEALSMATFVAELAPDSELAPEATLLAGHLFLQLGLYGEATVTYQGLVDGYARVSDEIDALLSLGEDPVRTFDQLVGRRDEELDPAAVLPPVVARWAARSDDVALALGLVRSLDEARREVRQARDVAARLETLLARGGGIDAFPALRRAQAEAELAGSAAARAEGAYVAALSRAAAPLLAPEERAEWEAARAARAAAEQAFERLPRTVAQVEERRARLRARVGAVEREAFRLGLAAEGCLAAVSGIETYLERHHAELSSDADARQELKDELRTQRAVVTGYEGELAALRREAAAAGDAAGGAEAMAADARLRAEYLAALDRERVAAGAVRGRAAAPVRALFERVEAARARLAAVRARAGTAEERALAEASRRAIGLRAQVDADRAALASQDAALDGLQAASKEVVGRIALRALAEVRARFHELVLQADVGLVDVAWSRKKQRLEELQRLAAQKQVALEELERAYRAVLREVE
jgi:hypothetical protein